MAKTFNPFAELDFSKYLSDLKLPGLDMEAAANAYRKNIEAVAAAGQVAVEGAQAVAKRQAEIFRQSFEEYGQLLREFATPTTAEEAAAKQTELAKRSFETALNNLRELSQLIAKANNQSLELLNKRAAEILEEVKSLTASAMKKASKAA